MKKSTFLSLIILMLSVFSEKVSADLSGILSVAGDSVIVDNLDDGFSSVGSWQTISFNGYGSDGNFAYIAVEDFSDDAVATWTFDIPADGAYEVSVTWPYSSGRRASDIHYKIENESSEWDIYDFNQDTAITIGQFIPVDTVDAQTGQLLLKVYASQTNTVCADAAMIKLLAPASIPNAPAGLQVSCEVNSTQIDLVWTDNSFDESGFFIQRSMDGVNYSTIDSVGANITAFQDAGLSDSTVYYYQVAAYNINGNSDFTDPASIATSYGGVIVDNLDDVFSTVGAWQTISFGGYGTDGNYAYIAVEDYTEDAVATWGFDISVEGNYEVSVTWKHSADHRASDVHYKILNGSSEWDIYDFNQDTAVKIGEFVPIDTVNAFTGQLLLNVYASQTNTVCADAAMIRFLAQPPITPSELQAIVVTNQIDLSWTDNSSDENGFVIQRSLDGVNYNTIDSVKADVTAYKDTGLLEATVYYYQVAAYNAGGNSDFTDAISATTSYGGTIIDNSDDDFSFVGAWQTIAHEDAYGTDFAYLVKDDYSDDAVGTWTFDVPSDGAYEVSVTWVYNPYRATDAHYKIQSEASELDIYNIDQTFDPEGEFVILDTVDVQKGQLILNLYASMLGTVCADAAKIREVTSTSAKDLFSEMVKIYPNPVSDILTISVAQSLSKYSLRIYSLFGEKLFEQNLAVSNFRLDMSDYSTGIYVLELSDNKGEKQFVRKIIKE